MNIILKLVRIPCLEMGFVFFDHNHQYSNYHVEKIAFNYGKISIGKNCWIGANVVILKGVTIGDNVIIGAGAVIHKDIPSNSIVVSKRGTHHKRASSIRASCLYSDSFGHSGKPDLFGRKSSRSFVSYCS